MRWLALVLLLVSVTAKAEPVGVVIMHGKGGSPARYVDGLAAFLHEKGCAVANLEMPWSGRRNYDVDVAAAEKEVEAALEALRAKGAQKLFVAGHSQGGMFALYFGTRHAVDGIIAIAPGGSTGAPVYRQKLGESLARAKALVAQGKGAEKESFKDFESGRGTYPVIVAPAVYVTWFDPEGAMNGLLAAKGMKPQTPVLYIAPSGDYPALQRVKVEMFGALPANPLTRLYEPSASHLQAPAASSEEILKWISQVSTQPSP
jgi:pimeloyl-ACP methyl ester carboxylesterase